MLFNTATHWTNMLVRLKSQASIITFPLMIVSMLISVYSSFAPSASKPFWAEAEAAPSRTGLQPIEQNTNIFVACVTEAFIISCTFCLTYLWRCPFGSKTCPLWQRFSSVRPSCFHRPNSRVFPVSDHSVQGTLVYHYLHFTHKRLEVCGCFHLWQRN